MQHKYMRYCDNDGNTYYIRICTHTHTRTHTHINTYTVSRRLLNSLYAFASLVAFLFSVGYLEKQSLEKKRKKWISCLKSSKN